MSKVPTVEEIAAMRKDLDLLGEKIATAKGTLVALDAQRIQYENQLKAANVDPEKGEEILGIMAEDINAKYVEATKLKDQITAVLSTAEVSNG